MRELWKECLSCESICCNHEIVTLLFVTDEELKRIGKKHPEEAKALKDGKMPCPFLKDNKLCSIHDIKPADCRLFPFDIMKDGDKFYWIIRQIDCAILEDEDFEGYLCDLEEKVISSFYPHLEAYSLHQWDDTIKVCDHKILREVIVRKLDTGC